MKKLLPIAVLCATITIGSLCAQNSAYILPATHTISSGSSVELEFYSPAGVTWLQWQKSVNNGPWTSIQGITGSSYNTDALINNGSTNITIRYRVELVLFDLIHNISDMSVITVTPNVATINFSYDASGNRTSRTVFLPSPPPSPSDADAFTDPVLANEFSEKIYTDKLNESDVLIFPNPTQGALAVEIQNMNPQIPHHLTVFNIRGAVVFERSNIADRTEIDLSAQPSGVYIMRIFTKDSAIAWRIVKE